ncbi:hypothetical protein PHAVU_007G165000 [Phaseolus vulgaris]|uniref:TF-B3 domain-containing protein n=1 Tax=Phaseolus vulgaris TaxID=3885 RepID=V7BG42_PHAVU|nr:hypothetical protein PHAVU_007G165000g [Phaseolus vulgaris]ESW16540.1 hypothetical protein PHAVU_007G165000g [Phaseolus vulgaris]
MSVIPEEIVKLSAKGLFTTVNIHGENGHVDRTFAIEFENELEEEWTLSDSQGNIHIVYYNKDILCPQIVYGWSRLSDFYGFKGDHNILFRYLSSKQVFGGYVDLPSPFAEYIRRGKFKKVNLHGWLQDVECTIFKSRNPSRSVTLCSGWKQFCRLHSIREDDKIIFECYNKKSSSDIRVLLLMTCHYKRPSA